MAWIFRKAKTKIKNLKNLFYQKFNIIHNETFSILQKLLKFLKIFSLLYSILYLCLFIIIIIIIIIIILLLLLWLLLILLLLLLLLFCGTRCILIRNICLGYLIKLKAFCTGHLQNSPKRTKNLKHF